MGGRAVLDLKCLWLEGKGGWVWLGVGGWGDTGVKFYMCTTSPKQI